VLEVELTRKERNERYRVLVDALNGEVQLRQRLTIDSSEATFEVFTSDSPHPFRRVGRPRTPINLLSERVRF
jgi:hypothetical protein